MVLKDDSGEPLAGMETPDGQGRTVFERIPSGTVVVCALAHWDYGGAEAARVDLSGETRRVDVVVGRAFPIGVRLRRGGKPALPAQFELLVRYPGPSPIPELCHETVRDATEDADAGTLRFSARPHAPGKPVAIELRVADLDPLRAEVRPAADGGVAWVEFELPAE